MQCSSGQCIGSVLKFGKLKCNEVQCSAVKCSAVQSVQCSAVQCMVATGPYFALSVTERPANER